MSPADLNGLCQRVEAAIYIGQRAGDFTLAKALEGGTPAWPSGRCFNETLEVRWWPADDGDERAVLILNCLPNGWTAPDGWERSHLLAAPPVEVPYLCVGRYDEDGSEDVHEWWEPRYGRAFHYLDSAPSFAKGEANAGHPDKQGRAQLVTMEYELEDGRAQHRLIRFQHVVAKDGL